MYIYLDDPQSYIMQHSMANCQSQMCQVYCGRGQSQVNVWLSHDPYEPIRD